MGHLTDAWQSCNDCCDWQWGGYPLTDYGLTFGDLQLVTPPTFYAIGLEEVKRQIRLTNTSIDDQFINEMIPEVQEAVELGISGHRQLSTATYDLPVSGWWGGELKLPRPPFQSLTSVKYYDNLGTLTTLDPSTYIVTPSTRGQASIIRAPDQLWVNYQWNRQYPVTIRFVAGYASAALVPPTLKRAMKLLAGFWYENREAYADKATEEVGNPGFSLSSLLAMNGYGSYA